jgi:UDP-N-acetyl-D-glucosamine/UDP-N-acetyl-D-galactosamine dehydrogenase
LNGYTLVHETLGSYAKTVAISSYEVEVMKAFTVSQIKVAVVGLGYVGLPLALSLAKSFPVFGYDYNRERLNALRLNEDVTGEVSKHTLATSALTLIDNPLKLGECGLFIIAVPTPIDAKNQPDLSALIAASEEVGGALSKGAIVVYESTVYPGVTENVCGPTLERASGLKCGEDFFLGYSPERINPGDKIHTVDKITKIVAGQTPEVADFLAAVYGAAVSAGIHVAPTIKTAEAAKVIENAQRDINIAFINEVTMIFQCMGIDTGDVLEAARTKWNFLDFRPGLVGGHCIGVDPFYLAHAAEGVEHLPEVILAGRRINDGMAQFVAERIAKQLPPKATVLVLGLAFKENVADLRNSKVADMIAALHSAGHTVSVHDPLVDAQEAALIYGLDIQSKISTAQPYDAIIVAVAHEVFRQTPIDQISASLRPDGLLADLKGIWRSEDLPPRVKYWRL